MTKEELSITYENNIFYCTKNNTKWISVDGEKWYGDEKRITELEAQNERLCQSITDFQNREAGLESQIAELEAQIEKMKCCYNCKHSRTDYVHCITDKHENWEMIEK